MVVYNPLWKSEHC